MNHPSKEELLSYLYDDVDGAQRAELSQHLKECDYCGRQMQAWRETQKNLAAWQIAPRSKRKTFPLVIFKWAAAAAVLLLVGFGIGRSGSKSFNEGELRAELASALQQQIEEQIAAARAADRRQFIQMLRDVEEQRISDYAQLRKDLETVAVVADQKLTSTEQALQQLHVVAQTPSSQRTQ